MTKEVLVSISGMQFAMSEEGSDIQVVTLGEYYERNNSHFLLYEEVDEEGNTTKNIMKFRPDLLELTKKGAANVHMLFEEGKKNLTNYSTMFGDILIGVDTRKILLAETEEKITIDVEYTLDINYEFLADCRIHIDIAAKEAAKGIMLT